ncbi:hypothetical protein KAR91_77265 [Candidatus Pacearchaeota archaeon]|nr:hypothetical protein [Candidatus Pacearchaeota archaeon]
MIIEQCTPKSKTNDPYFKYNIPFHGDITKTYTCRVTGSNAPTPKVIGFTTNGTGQNMVIMEFALTCNNRPMTIEFMTQSEAVEENKIKFLTWLLGYFTWFNFIFRIFSLKTLKFITKAIAVGIAVPVAFGLVFAVTEYTYESITGDDFEDSSIVEYWSNFTIPAIGRYFREDAVDDAGEFKDFIKEKAGDGVEAVTDKIDDIKG